MYTRDAYIDWCSLGFSKYPHKHLLEQLLALANHKGHKTIYWSNQNLKQLHVASTKCGNDLCEHVTTGFGFTSDWLGGGSGARFLSQSEIVVIQNQSQCELLLTLAPLTNLI